MDIDQILVDLDNIIFEDFKVRKNVDGHLIFYEENSNASGKFVKIKTKGKIVAFSLDQNEDGEFRVYPFFNKSIEGINSKNDGIIIFKKDNHLCVFLLEIKSTLSNDAKKKALSQLRKGKAFVDFLFEIYKDSNEIEKIDYVIKEGIFYNDQRKLTSKRKSSKENNTDSISKVEFFIKKANEIYELEKLFI